MNSYCWKPTSLNPEYKRYAPCFLEIIIVSTKRSWAEGKVNAAKAEYWQDVLMRSRGLSERVVYTGTYHMVWRSIILRAQTSVVRQQ